MHTEVITSTEQLLNLKDDWEKLQNQDTDIAYYSTYEYVKTWWDIYKEDEDKSLFIICVYEDTNVVGIGPFMIYTHNIKLFKYNTLTFLGKGDYLNVLINKGKMNEITIIKNIFDIIEKNKNSYQNIELTNIEHNSILTYFLLRSTKYNKFFSCLMECPRMYFKNFINYDHYKKLYVSHSAIQYRNKLAREVRYTFKIISNEKYDVYEIISKVHKDEQNFLIKEKKRKDRVSLFEDIKRSNFVKSIYKNNGHVLTFIIEDEYGQTIIYNTCYLHNRTLFSWNTAFDTKYEKYNLGRIINNEIVMYIFNTKIADIFDFGAGRYPWKYEWTKDFTYVYRLDFWYEHNFKWKVFKLIKKIYNLKKYFSEN